MPNIYLSPSTQEYNTYVTGGSEEYYMNLIADAMEPYLRASGVQWTRNTPDMTAAQSIAASNRGNYGLHLALHSNAAPEQLSGQIRGTDVYYYPPSVQGRRGAEITAGNLKAIYPDPNLVRTKGTTRLGEVSKTKAPSVFIEFAYHDNVDDANWIINNIQEIARNVSLSVTEFFGIPLLPPQPERPGVVTVQQGNLNIRSRPNVNAPVIATAPNGASLTVLGRWQDWYVVDYRGNVGYAAARYITLV